MSLSRTVKDARKIVRSAERVGRRDDKKGVMSAEIGGKVVPSLAKDRVVSAVDNCEASREWANSVAEKGEVRVKVVPSLAKDRVVRAVDNCEASREWANSVAEKGEVRVKVATAVVEGKEEADNLATNKVLKNSTWRILHEKL
jgi:predicted anti-sigma-YlaC factor YlaD